MASIRFLRLLFVLAIAVLAIAPANVNAEAECATGECVNPDVTVEDPSCPSRDLIIRCVSKTLDANENGKLDREELESAINRLPWYSRGILKVIGSVDKIMAKCDIDKVRKR
jgi:hypothetical protein